MHIAEGGIITVGVTAAGWAITGCGVVPGMRRLSDENIPTAAVIGAGFFAISLIHIPVPPSSVHLVLNGLAGIILGWTVFPVILVGLLLQAIFFNIGGLTVLGVNTATMALPALFCHYIFRIFRQHPSNAVWYAGGFLCGSLAILMSAALVFIFLFASRSENLATATVFIAGHAWVMIIEGFVTAAAVLFLKKVRPELFQLNLRGTEE